MLLSSRSPVVLACLVALPLLVSLVGCSSLMPIVGSIVTATTDSNVAPVVGDCWNATFDGAASTSTWVNGDPVSCSKKHQTYTFGMSKIAGISGEWGDAKTGEMRDDVTSAASTACSAAQARFLPGLRTTESRFLFAYYVPSKAAWQAGARWVRCDLSVVNIGSSFIEPTLSELPTHISDLLSSFAAHPDLFALCINTGDPVASADPLSSESATYADCAKDPQWREKSESNLPGDASSPFPEDSAIAAFNQANCGAAADARDEQWTVYAPDSETWKTGDRIVECWVATKSSTI